MESIGNVTQVTSDAAQQASETNKKQLEKQPTEKSSALFLGALNTQGDEGTLTIDRATPLFVLLIARLNGSGDNGSSGDTSNGNTSSDGSGESEMTYSPNSGIATDTTNTANNTTTMSVASTNSTDGDSTNTSNNATSSSSTNSANTSANANNSSGDSAIFNTTSIPSLGAPSTVRTPIFNVTIPNLAGNTNSTNNANQTTTPANNNTGNNTGSNTPATDNTSTNNNVNSGTGTGTVSTASNTAATDSTSTNNNVNSGVGTDTPANVRRVPVFGNVTVPSLGSVGGTSNQGQAADGANATAVGAPLVRASPIATQVGTGFQSLLAGNSSADNNTGNSSHWRRGSGSSGSSASLNISGLSRR
jgi:hypothetical protein